MLQGYDLLRKIHIYVWGLPLSLFKMLGVIIYSLYRELLVQHSLPSPNMIRPSTNKSEVLLAMKGMGAMQFMQSMGSFFL